MTTVRAWFTKRHEAAYISLLDLQRVIQRALKRACIPVWYTQGFNPHIYLTFAAPLSLGQESLTESFEFRMLEETPDFEAVAKRLNACLPKGVEVLRVEPVGMDTAKIAYAEYEVQYTLENAKAARAAFAAYLALDTAPIMKKSKRGIKEVDLKPLIAVDALREGEGLTVFLTCPAGSTLNVNPALLLQFLEQSFHLPVVWGDILRLRLLTGDKTAFT